MPIILESIAMLVRLIRRCAHGASRCNTESYDEVHEAFVALLAAGTPAERRETGDRFTASIAARNARRSAQEIAAMERARGLDVSRRPARTRTRAT